MNQPNLFAPPAKPLHDYTLRDWDTTDPKVSHQAYADATDDERERFARRCGLGWPTDFKPTLHLKEAPHA